MSKKSEFYNIANLYSSEILNEGFLGRTAKGAVKGAGAGGLLGGVAGAGLGYTLGGLQGAIDGAKLGGVTGAIPGAGIGGVTNAAAGHDDDEEDKDSIELSLPKSDISNICKSLKKALGAEEDSEEEYAKEKEDDASEEEAEDSFVNAYNKFGNAEKGTGALLKQLPADAPKDLMSAYKSFGAPNPGPAGSLNYGWVPPVDAATSAVADTATGAATEVAKGMNPWLLGGLAAGGGLLAGKMLGGKKDKEEEEDVKVGIGSAFGDLASKAGDLASKAGEFAKGVNPLAAAGIGLGGGLLASKLMDDDEEEGDNNVSKALEYSRTEISNRLSNALNSLEEFDVKKARAVLKNLINDL